MIKQKRKRHAVIAISITVVSAASK